MASSLVIKPYIFECVLYKSIDVKQSRLELADNCARFILKKRDEELWKQLTSEVMRDKNEFQKIKQEAIIEFQEHEKAREQQKKTQVREAEKKALNELMRIEGFERERIAREKKEAGDKAMEELVRFHEEEQKRKAQLQAQIQEAKALANRMSEERRNTAVVIPKSVPASDDKNTPSGDTVLLEKPCELPIRESNRITISFTPRVFPTPERESTKREEEEWLNKQAEHRRAMMQRVVAGSEYSEQEQDPIWLREKGDSLFKAGDYEAAVVAYTRAISLNPKLHTAYSNRAGCHLKLGNYFKALEDSSVVLDLCVPAVQQNLRSRVRAHVRRGAAFCHLQMYREGLVEYRAAQKLDPNDASIAMDVQNVEKYLQEKSGICMND
ncbi:unnamed protein product [Echinostoma caproni]|uniref:TPR_REGION domain-containing protein n=1 Tax=Echinostoma caproni TaxID=27848 RepID=A0A183ARG6_9TREM|nr:unnamed protein product [Echinostoma caproni]